MRNQTLLDLGTSVYMCRGAFFAACVNHPGWVVEVEGGAVIEQLHVRLPIRVDSAYILPVASERIGVDAFSTLHHCWDNVATEVMPGRRTSVFGSPSILNQDTDQCFTIKYVDAHSAESSTRLARLLLKGNDPSLGIRFQNAKAMTFLDRYDSRTKRDIGAVLLMERNHGP